MVRTRYLLSFLFGMVLLGLAEPAKANYANCWWGITDVTTVIVTAGNIDYYYVTYHMGYTCTDGYLNDERPYDPGDTGGGSTGGGTTTPPPPPPPPPGCSRSSCLADCDTAYMEHAGVETVGEATIYHFIDSECGTFCQELSRLQFEACQADCITDCTAP